MADIRAGIAPQKDTYTNWVLLDPILGKNDSGDNFSQMIFASASPVGDILIWGNNEKFAVAYAAGQFVIQKDEIIPNPPYDISAANTVITLPAITGGIQIRSYYWTGGDGSHTFKFTTGVTVGGIDSALWVGEGEGRILLESDGTNWQVREYEDYLTDGANQKVWKMKDGTEKQLITSPVADAVISTVYNGVFRSATTYGSVSRFHNYVSIDSESVSYNESSENLIWLGTSLHTPSITTTHNVFIYSGSSNPDADFVLGYESIGRWRT